MNQLITPTNPVVTALDRFTRGFIAGFIGGIGQTIVSNVLYYTGFSSLRWVDYMGYILFAEKAGGFGEQVLAKGAQMLFVSILGSLFAYLVPYTTSRIVLLKGLLFGGGWWVIINAIMFLFKVDALAETSFQTTLSNALSASTWGIVMAISLRWLDRREAVPS